MHLWGEAGYAQRVTTCDGIQLAIERYGEPSGTAPVLVFIHGIAAYAGPYRRFARSLAEKGLVVYLPHLRGHGDSGGQPGRLADPDTLLSDVAAVLDFVAGHHPGREVVLGGESMGGLIALAAAASDRTPPLRLLLLSPALRLALPQIARSALEPSMRGRLLAPGIPAQGSPSAPGTRDPAFREACLADPLMLQTVSLGYLATIASLMRGWRRRYPARVNQPTLVVQGEADRLLDMRGSIALADLLPHGELRLVPDAWHNLLYDPTTDDTVEAVVDWLVTG